MHIHPESEEIYYVVGGRDTVYVGEERREMEINKDTAVYIPPGTTHGIRNTGSEKLVVTFSVAPGRERSQEVHI